MCYADKLMVMPEYAILAPPICRLAREVLPIGRQITQRYTYSTLPESLVDLQVEARPQVEVAYKQVPHDTLYLAEARRKRQRRARKRLDKASLKRQNYTVTFSLVQQTVPIGCSRIIRTFYFDVLKEGQNNFIFRLYSAAWST